MSRHRIVVRETVDGFATALRPLFTLQALQQLAVSGESEFIINAVTGRASLDGFGVPKAVRTKLRSPVKKIGSEVREAFVSVKITRIDKSMQPCVTTEANSPPQLTGTARQFQVLVPEGKSVLRTRYVHMWHEWQIQESWPLSWVA